MPIVQSFRTAFLGDHIDVDAGGSGHRRRRRPSGPTSSKLAGALMVMVQGEPSGLNSPLPWVSREADALKQLEEAALSGSCFHQPTPKMSFNAARRWASSSMPCSVNVAAGIDGRKSGSKGA